VPADLLKRDGVSFRSQAKFSRHVPKLDKICDTTAEALQERPHLAFNLLRTSH
jgi:hypothetical protein